MSQSLIDIFHSLLHESMASCKHDESIHTADGIKITNEVHKIKKVIERSIVLNPLTTTKELYHVLYSLAMEMFNELVLKKHTFSNYCFHSGFVAGIKSYVLYGVMVFPVKVKGELVPLQFDIKIESEKITLSKHY